MASAGGIMQVKPGILFEATVQGFFQQVSVGSAKELMLWVKVYFYLCFCSLLGPSHKRVGLFIIFSSFWNHSAQKFFEVSLLMQAAEYNTFS